jgi:hypothetical protein
MALARWLLHTPAPPARPVRLLGLTASNFARASPATAPVQLTLSIGDLAPSASAPASSRGGHDGLLTAIVPARDDCEESEQPWPR